MLHRGLQKVLWGLVGVSLLVGCGKRPEFDVDQEFLPYVEQFFTDIESMGHSVPLKTFSIHFGTVGSSLLGTCIRSDDGSHAEIYINSDRWPGNSTEEEKSIIEAADEAEATGEGLSDYQQAQKDQIELDRAFIIYHEAGHCGMQLGHLDGTIMNRFFISPRDRDHLLELTQAALEGTSE